MLLSCLNVLLTLCELTSYEEVLSGKPKEFKTFDLQMNPFNSFSK